MENLEELVDFSLQEITQPIDQLGPESPVAQAFSYSPPKYPLRVMVVVVNQLAWRSRTPCNLAAPLHDLPKYPERVLPKFDPGKGISVEDHLKSFYLALILLNVDHKYLVYILFPYTFDPRASSWYFSLHAN